MHCSMNNPGRALHSFFMLALLVEYIFLATFYGHINHKFLHITLHYKKNFISSICQRANCDTLSYVISLFIHDNNRLLPGFEPQTNHLIWVPSRCATNWAILAWIHYIAFSDLPYVVIYKFWSSSSERHVVQYTGHGLRSASRSWIIPDKTWLDASFNYQRITIVLASDDFTSEKMNSPN